MIICDSSIIQGSDEWFAIKAGVPSAGSFDKIITSNGERSKQREKYLYQLAGERITGYRESTYSNQNMQNGTDREPICRMVFEMLMEVEIQEVGFVFFDERKDRGASPDGLIVGRKEGFEMKNPLISTHIGYLLRGKLPADYYAQVHGNMYITGYDAWHFMSFVENMPPFILKIERDEKFIVRLNSELDSFCQELNEITAKLKAFQ
jgi:hypothetical protein